MSRLPFDPGKMAGPGAPATPVSPAPLRVAQLAGLIEGAVRGLPAPVRVVGEISNFTHRGHWYFALKDADAVVSCVMFAGRAKSAGFVPTDGQEVVVSGRVEFYKPQGRVSFYVESMEPVGVGALQAAYRKLVEEIKSLGWMDPQRKRPLPAFPRRIAVITSRTGAALQDVLATARKRCPAVELALIDVLVQGSAAAPDIVRALRFVSANHRRLGIDAVILTRGGGSIEDLWAFNERAVAEAVVDCAVPVVAAIGHETDVTIAELVADERSATPTQAAMRLTPDRAALREQMDLLTERLRYSTLRARERARERLLSHARALYASVRARAQTTGRSLEQAFVRLERLRPASLYALRAAALTHAVRRLTAAVGARLTAADVSAVGQRLQAAWTRRSASQAEALVSLERQLGLVGPQAVLGRGYSVTFGPGGVIIRDPGLVRAGQTITTRLERGTLDSVVRGTTHDSLAPPTPLPKTRKPRIGRPDDGPGLFA